MFFSDYNFYIADYKLIVRRNKLNTILNLILSLAMWVGFNLWMMREIHGGSFFKCFILLGVAIGLYHSYKKLRDTTILEVDSQAQTILLRDNRTIEYGDVLWIEISQTKNSSGYYQDYLMLILPNKDFEKIVAIGNNPFANYNEAYELARALCLFLAKEFKSRPNK